jgi:hypothetical protein
MSKPAQRLTLGGRRSSNRVIDSDFLRYSCPLVPIRWPRRSVGEGGRLVELSKILFGLSAIQRFAIYDLTNPRRRSATTEPA